MQSSFFWSKFGCRRFLAGFSRSDFGIKHCRENLCGSFEKLAPLSWNLCVASIYGVINVLLIAVTLLLGVFRCNQSLGTPGKLRSCCRQLLSLRKFLLSSFGAQNFPMTCLHQLLLQDNFQEEIRPWRLYDRPHDTLSEENRQNSRVKLILSIHNNKTKQKVSTSFNLA